MKEQIIEMIKERMIELTEHYEQFNDGEKMACDYVINEYELLIKNIEDLDE